MMKQQASPHGHNKARRVHSHVRTACVTQATAYAMQVVPQ